MASNSYYTPKEDDLLRKLYPITNNKELLALFPNRTPGGLIQRASVLGLKKDKRFYDLGYQAEESIMGHLSEVEKAYLAGIIDADGCIRVNRRISKTCQPVYALFVQIYTTSPALIKWLEEHFPGKHTTQRDARKEHPSWRTGWVWVLSGNRRVMIFCQEIAPYLIIKREQAELIASGYVHLPEPERFALFQKMKDLKRTS